MTIKLTPAQFEVIRLLATMPKEHDLDFVRYETNARYASMGTPMLIASTKVVNALVEKGLIVASGHYMPSMRLTDAGLQYCIDKGLIEAPTPVPVVDTSEYPYTAFNDDVQGQHVEVVVTSPLSIHTKVNGGLEAGFREMVAQDTPAPAPSQPAPTPATMRLLSDICHAWNKQHFTEGRWVFGGFYAAQQRDLDDLVARGYLVARRVKPSHAFDSYMPTEAGLQAAAAYVPSVTEPATEQTLQAVYSLWMALQVTDEYRRVQLNRHGISSIFAYKSHGAMVAILDELKAIEAKQATAIDPEGLTDAQSLNYEATHKLGYQAYQELGQLIVWRVSHKRTFKWQKLTATELCDYHKRLTRALIGQQKAAAVPVYPTE